MKLGPKSLVGCIIALGVEETSYLDWYDDNNEDVCMNEPPAEPLTAVVSSYIDIDVMLPILISKAKGRFVHCKNDSDVNNIGREMFNPIIDNFSKRFIMWVAKLHI